MTASLSAPLADLRLVRHHDLVTVTVTGQLDLSNQLQLAQLVLPHADDAQHVVLDLSGVTFVDMTTIGIVARLRLDLARHGGLVHVVPSRRVRRALDLCGLTDEVELHDDVDAAVRAAAPAPL